MRSLPRVATIPIAVSAILATIRTALTADFGVLLWSLGVLAVPVVALGIALGANRIVDARLREFPLAFGLVLAGFAIVDGITSIGGLQMDHRVGVLFGNPNLLGAAIAVNAVAALILAKRLWPVGVLILISLIAILFTGSRNSAMGLAIGITIYWLGLLRRDRSTALRLALYGVCIACGTMAVMFSAYRSAYGQSGGNMLVSSDNLNHSIWITDYAEEFYFERDSGSGPVEGGHVTHVVAKSDSKYASGVVLLQRLGRPKAGEEFVASVFVRADYPQVIELSNGFSRAQCAVVEEWSRCSTPPGLAVDNRFLYFQLRSQERGGTLDVFLWGAQVERGLQPTEPTRSTSTVLTEIGRLAVLPRFLPAGGSFVMSISESIDLRVEQWRVAWRAFLTNPIVGVGVGEFERLATTHYLEQGTESPPGITHAHDLPLQLLTETGMLGFLAWLLPFAASVALLGNVGLALVAVIGVMNVFDYTYYHAGVYYTYWLSVGLMYVLRGRNRLPAQGNGLDPNSKHI